MTMTYLFDADVVAYRAAAGVEVATDWGDGLWTYHAEEIACAEAIEEMIENTCRKLGEADRLIMALTDPVNWRHDVLPTYKGNRKETRKPLLLPFARQYLRDNHEVFERPTLEGDDVLGILMTSKKIVPGDKVCISIDKDLKTIPGFHHNLTDHRGHIFEVTEEEADRYHLMQTLIGDQTDGYAGCPGVGETVANEFLDNPYELVPTEREIQRGKNAGTTVVEWRKQPTDNVWTGIVSLYAKVGLTEAVALQQARVARILRSTDYDFKKKEPILWKPK